MAGGSKSPMSITRRAFSLVEILVAISVISLLIALTLPGLASARSQALRLNSLVNARTLAIAVTQYSGDHGGRVSPPEPGRFYSAPFDRSGFRFSFPYWQGTYTWPSAMSLDQGYLSSYEVLLSPGSFDERPEANSHYQLTSAVFGQPALWGDRELTVSEIPAMRRGQRLSDVAFPSAKAMLWDGHMGYIGQRDRERALGEHGPIVPFPVATMDTAADMRSVPDLPAERINRDPRWVYGAFRLHHTPDGILGVDFGGG